MDSQKACYTMAVYSGQSEGLLHYGGIQSEGLLHYDGILY